MDGLPLETEVAPLLNVQLNKVPSHWTLTTADRRIPGPLKTHLRRFVRTVVHLKRHIKHNASKWLEWFLLLFFHFSYGVLLLKGSLFIKASCFNYKSKDKHEVWDFYLCKVGFTNETDNGISSISENSGIPMLHAWWKWFKMTSSFFSSSSLVFGLKCVEVFSCLGDWLSRKFTVLVWIPC